MVLGCFCGMSEARCFHGGTEGLLYVGTSRGTYDGTGPGDVAWRLESGVRDGEEDVEPGNVCRRADVQRVCFAFHLRSVWAPSAPS